MARTVQVKVIDGKNNTVDESIVSYQIGIPSDVLFHTKDGIIYAQWWKDTDRLITIPASQLVSID